MGEAHQVARRVKHAIQQAHPEVNLDATDEPGSSGSGTERRIARLIPELGLTPLHPFRMGYAMAEKNRMPRRAVEEVIRQD
jgi:hypothetical protein